MRIRRSLIFEESPNSERIFSYFNRRLGQYLAPIGVLKVQCIHSAGSNYPRLSMLHEARSREFKSITTKLAMRMFEKDMYIYLSGDTTIHALEEDYGTNLDGKCIIVDDGNLLFKAMAKRSSDRWLSAIAVLLTERIYKHGIKRERFRLAGRISTIINLTTPSFLRHKNELFETTLGDRLFIVHGWLREKENLQCKKNFESTKRLKLPVLIAERYNRTIKNLSEYEDELVAYAKDYAILSVRSTAETLDLVKAVVSENARINHRNYLCEDDIALVRMLRQYNIDPMVPDEPRVIGFLKEGRSSKDICHLLGKDPNKFYPIISYYKKRALTRGALDAT